VTDFFAGALAFAFTTGFAIFLAVFLTGFFRVFVLQ
jgi:hypothetical protein